MQQPGRSNVPSVMSPGCSAVSPPTSAAPAVRQPAATRPDELGDALGHEPADRDVVEERERLGAGAHDVVGAHRDEVDADRVEAADRLGDRGLGPDAVGRGDEERLAVAGRDRDRATEPTEAADDLGPPRRVDVGAHQVDGAVARRDVHARSAVRGPVASPLPATHRSGRATGSSSMNLRLAASYGTGSG